jgi:hypothetical protein
MLKNIVCIGHCLQYRASLFDSAAVSNILYSSRLETWEINGNVPERLCRLLETGCTIGTKIEHRRY